MKRYDTAERFERLREQLVEASDCLKDVSKIPILHQPLKDIQKYKYIAFTEEDLEDTLYDSIKECLEKNTESFFIKDGDEYIGFISYWTLQFKKVVAGILFFNFNPENNSNEFFKDTLCLLLKLRSEYDRIDFEADIDNTKAIRVYKIYCDRHEGSYKETPWGTIKFTVPGVKFSSQNNIRESIAECNRFEGIFLN